MHASCLPQLQNAIVQVCSVHPQTYKAAAQAARTSVLMELVCQVPLKLQVARSRALSQSALSQIRNAGCTPVHSWSSPRAHARCAQACQWARPRALFKMHLHNSGMQVCAPACVLVELASQQLPGPSQQARSRLCWLGGQPNCLFLTIVAGLCIQNAGVLGLGGRASALGPPSALACHVSSVAYHPRAFNLERGLVQDRVRNMECANTLATERYTAGLIASGQRGRAGRCVSCSAAKSACAVYARCQRL